VSAATYTTWIHNTALLILISQVQSSTHAVGSERVGEVLYKAAAAIMDVIDEKDNLM